jgi:hypothetical protein
MAEVRPFHQFDLFVTVGLGRAISGHIRRGVGLRAARKNEWLKRTLVGVAFGSIADCRRNLPTAPNLTEETPHAKSLSYNKFRQVRPVEQNARSARSRLERPTRKFDRPGPKLERSSRKLE